MLYFCIEDNKWKISNISQLLCIDYYYFVNVIIDNLLCWSVEQDVQLFLNKKFGCCSKCLVDCNDISSKHLIN